MERCALSPRLPNKLQITQFTSKSFNWINTYMQAHTYTYKIPCDFHAQKCKQSEWHTQAFAQSFVILFLAAISISCAFSAPTSTALPVGLPYPSPFQSPSGLFPHLSPLQCPPKLHPRRLFLTHPFFFKSLSSSMGYIEMSRETERVAHLCLSAACVKWKWVAVSSGTCARMLAHLI